MYIAGSCPGNIFVQIGSNVGNWYYTYTGTLIAGLYYFFDEVHKEKNKPKNPAPVEVTSIDKRVGVKYPMLAIPIAAVVIGSI